MKMEEKQLVLGVLSDNHGESYPQVLEELADCDAILHAGDVGNIQILQDLAKLGSPLYVATGNNDLNVVRKVSLEFKLITFEEINLRVLMTHDPGAYNAMVLQDPPQNIQQKIDEFKPHIFVFGHWHKRFAETVNGIFCFNPGGITKRYTRDGHPGFSKLYVKKSAHNGSFEFEPKYFDL